MGAKPVLHLEQNRIETRVFLRVQRVFVYAQGLQVEPELQGGGQVEADADALVVGVVVAPVAVIVTRALVDLDADVRVAAACTEVEAAPARRGRRCRSR